VSAIDGKGKQRLSLVTTRAYRNVEHYSLHRYNRELLQKLVPREGLEKGRSKVMGISLVQVIKRQEYRSVQQVKNGVPFFL
jgi:hypothetical protein